MKGADVSDNDFASNIVDQKPNGYVNSPFMTLLLDNSYVMKSDLEVA